MQMLSQAANNQEFVSSENNHLSHLKIIYNVLPVPRIPSLRDVRERFKVQKSIETRFAHIFCVTFKELLRGDGCVSVRQQSATPVNILLGAFHIRVYDPGP